MPEPQPRDLGRKLDRYLLAGKRGERSVANVAEASAEHLCRDPPHKKLESPPHAAHVARRVAQHRLPQ